MELGRIRQHQRHRNSVERAQIARQYEASGLTCREFAKQKGFSLSSLTRWLAEARRPLSSESPVVFSEVKLTPPLSPLPGTGWAAELIGRDGITIRLRDEPSIRNLMELLRGKRC